MLETKLRRRVDTGLAFEKPRGHERGSCLLSPLNRVSFGGPLHQANCPFVAILLRLYTKDLWFECPARTDLSSIHYTVGVAGDWRPHEDYFNGRSLCYAMLEHRNYELIV
jgi:hypothetical protein